MTRDKEAADTRQARWARFRFSIIGPLLSAPPKPGELQSALEALSKKQWRHPITGEGVNFGVSTLERWFYRARRHVDPIGILRTKRRTDAAHSRTLSVELKKIIQQQYREHPGWSYQLHSVFPGSVRALIKFFNYDKSAALFSSSWPTTT